MNPRLPMRVARLVVAAAWADGEVSTAERAFLRKRFADVHGISGADWAELSELLEAPMTAAAQQGALEQVLEVVGSKEDKSFVLDTLVELLAADDVVSNEEIELLEHVRTALETKSTSVLSRVSRLVGGLLRNPPRSAERP